jgi:hypothetical protein
MFLKKSFLVLPDIVGAPSGCSLKVAIKELEKLPPLEVKLKGIPGSNNKQLN